VLDILADFRDALYLALVLASEEGWSTILTDHAGHLWRESSRGLRRLRLLREEGLTILPDVFRRDGLELM